VALERARFGEGPTAWTELRLEPDGERVIGREEMGAGAGYAPSEEDLAFLARLRHVHLGWLADVGAVRRGLAERGVSLSQDCAVAPGGEGLAVAFCSATDPSGDGPEVVAAAVAGGAGLAVATCGARGSVAYDGRRLVRGEVVGTFVADTTGAGDAFIAAFLDARLGGGDLAHCLAAGHEAGAVACTHLGGWPQGPALLAGGQGNRERAGGE